MILTLYLALVNLSEYTSPGDWVSLGFTPFLMIFGTSFWGLLWGVVGVGVYIGTDKNSYVTAVYLLIVCFIWGGLLATTAIGPSILSIFFIIIGFVFGTMLYDKLIQTRRET